ncbi:MAG TPA: uroporphyrinogen-III synthase [Anaerolineales bacterium]|nr:uroporphyrinogen-III synthase [Anaerolineales bacterium]
MNLIGKRVVITRPRNKAEGFAAALMAEGAYPIFFPVIKIIPADNFSAFDLALQSLEQFDWLILTSIHGVEAFFRRLETLGIQQFPPKLRVAAVGAKTAQCLSEHGIRTDYVPDEYVPEAILPGLGKNIYGNRFLFPQSNLARTVLADEIRFAGGVVTEVVAYRNVLSEPDAAEMHELCAGVDVVTFTSPSTVVNFVAIVQKNGLDPFSLLGNPLFACIGPITKKAAEDMGFVNLVTASEYTTAGLIESLDKLVIHQ